MHYVSDVLKLALVKKNMKHQAALSRYQGRHIFLAPHDEARQSNPIHLLHGLQQQDVTL